MPVKIPTRTFICFFGVMLSGFIFSIVIPETISIFLRCIIVLVIFVILFLYRGRLLAILKNLELKIIKQILLDSNLHNITLFSLFGLCKL